MNNLRIKRIRRTFVPVVMKLFHEAYGEGFPLIILHGMFGSLENWNTVSKSLSQHFRVLALDQRNHGRSPHSDIFSYEAMADDLYEFLVENNIPSTHVIGHSMGGKTAMRFAFDHPDMTTKLVIVDIAPKEYPPRHDYIFDGLFSLDLGQFKSRKELDAALAKDIPSQGTRLFLLKNLKRDEHGNFSWKINIDVLRRDYDRMNQAITSPTPFQNPALFVRSLSAGYVLDDDMTEIQRLFPFSRIIDTDTGHWIHAEAPEAFCSIVLDFLKEAG